jgi:hypothetical protein
MKLQELAELLRISVRKNGDGSQVFDWYRDGTVESHQKLADYALIDVEVTRAVYRKLTFDGD